MKDFINKILDVPKLIIRLWIILWLCLIILLIMKYCFGIWYPITVNNQILLDMGNFIDNSWIKYLILSTLYIFSSNVIYLITCIKCTYNSIYENILINSLVITAFVIKCFGLPIAYVIEVTFLVILPIIYLITKRKEFAIWKDILWTLLIQGLIILWQFNILLVRGLPSPLESVGTLIQVILQLDYYIFLTILWIGVSYMGLISVWLFVNDVTKLKAIRDAEASKKHPNEKLIKNINAKISKLEAR